MGQATWAARGWVRGGGKLESTTEREYQMQCGAAFELVVCRSLVVVPGELSAW
jgi:hypothetical protein